MATLRVFKSTLPSVNYIFGNGKSAVFQSGVYRTNIDWEITALEYEISLGHPHIFIDANEREIESEHLDPMVALKAKLREEILAEELAKMAVATDPKRDMGTSIQGQLKPASTQDIAVGAAGGNGAQGEVKLVNLKSK